MISVNGQSINQSKVNGKHRGRTGSRDIPKTTVLTSETLLQNILPLAEAQLGAYAAQGDANKKLLTFANIVIIAMQTVEQYSAQIGQLSGPDKLNAVKMLVPEILKLAVSSGLLTEEESARLNGQLTSGLDVVEHLVEAFVFISKNPYFIQAEEEIKKEITNCVGQCRKNKK